MPFTGHNPSAITKDQLIGLLRVIYQTFRHHMTWLSPLIENAIPNGNGSHGFPPVRGWNRRV